MSRSTVPAASCCSTSSLIAMSGARRSSPPTWRSGSGLACSLMRSSPRRCWTASATTRTSSPPRGLPIAPPHAAATPSVSHPRPGTDLCGVWEGLGRWKSRPAPRENVHSGPTRPSTSPSGVWTPPAGRQIAPQGLRLLPDPVAGSAHQPPVGHTRWRVGGWVKNWPARRQAAMQRRRRVSGGRELISATAGRVWGAGNLGRHRERTSIAALQGPSTSPSGVWTPPAGRQIALQGLRLLPLVPADGGQDDPIRLLAPLISHRWVTLVACRGVGKKLAGAPASGHAAAPRSALSSSRCWPSRHLDREQLVHWWSAYYLPSLHTFPLIHRQVLPLPQTPSPFTATTGILCPTARVGQKPNGILAHFPTGARNPTSVHCKLMALKWKSWATFRKGEQMVSGRRL